ncbi:MAG: TIGR01777 family oxidoreductase [Acidobacteriota bacterium]
MKILVTGATGLIGRHLCMSLKGEGHTVIALSRAPEKARGLDADEILKWDSMSLPPSEALSGTEAIVHLAGEPVADRRWTDEQKKRIRDSRVITTRNIVTGIRDASKRPAVFVSASAVGFYGERGDETLDESSAAGQGFLSEVCQEWEREAAAASELEVRTAIVRIGVVLSPDGGALKRMLTPFKLFAGGPLASGRQWFPWIHIRDVTGILRHALINPVSGPINAVAPECVTNAEFSRALGRALHRPAFMPTPEFALRMVFGERADVLLMSDRVIPKVATDTGYSFQFPGLAQSLEDLLG